MKNIWLRSILFILLSGVLLFGCSRKPGEKLYQEALTEWKAGNLVRARALLEKSIRRRAGSSENPAAYSRLGILLWEMGDSKGAVKAFDESCRLDGMQYDVLCNLGVALSARNDFSAAERAFSEASLLNPDDPRPVAFTGILYAKHQTWDDAARNLNRALKRQPSDPRLQTALALTELHTVGAEAALKRLQAVIRQNPDYAPALFNSASIQRYWLKNPAEARRLLDLYLAKAPSGAPFAAQTLPDRADGREKLNYTPPRTPDRAAADKIFQKALTYHKQNDFDNAVKWYTKAIEADDTYEQAFYNLGLAFYSVNRIELAADAFANAIRINPAFTAARYNSALAEYRLGNSDTALRELEVVLSQQPSYQPAIDLMNRMKKE
jgi:tetratricopeptide (TPR) repeat protein